MSDPINDYLTKVKIYRAAQAEAAGTATMIGHVSNAMNHKLQAFMHFNMDRSMQVTREQHVENIRFDFAKWPTSEIIKREFAALYDAHREMLGAWRAIPEPDREGLSAPRDSPSLA